jgi:CRISPR-associated protein Cas1
MPDRIVEIVTDGRHLAVDRGFMTVSEKGQEIARIPLDDISALIGTAHGLTYSNNLLVELARRNVVFVFCAANHTPIGFLWAVDGFHQQAARIDAQLESTLPKSKQIWKQIVQAKIEQQAAVLEAIGQNPISVSALARKVRSGDPENIEAQAARRYWSLLLGNDFRRDRDSGGINGMLNYGYMIIRSATARSIMAAGLHPSLPIHHKNANNPMRLVDDVMEPFRPYVDFAVWNLSQKGHESVTPEVKKILASLLDMEIFTEAGTTALRTGIQNTAVSLAQIYEGERDSLDLPLISPPLWQPHLEDQENAKTIQRTPTHVDDGHV